MTSKNKKALRLEKVVVKLQQQQEQIWFLLVVSKKSNKFIIKLY